jgi:hypothetical protein
MELTNQFGTRSNKTAAIVLKRLEHFRGCEHTVWMDSFYNSPEFGLVPEVPKKKTDFLGTLHTNRENVPPVVKNKKFKKFESCA